MKEKIEKVAMICGACDSITFLLIVYLILFLSSGQGNVINLIEKYSQLLVFFILPLTLLTFWRGHHDGERWYLGTNWVGRAIREGFEYGAAIPLIFLLTEYLASLLARENIFNDLIGIARQEPLWFFGILGIMVLLMGLIGASLASLFHAINRVIIME